MRLSSKQKRYWREPLHRWNIKCGATRSGKTYLDYFMIPRRIRAQTGRAGLILLMGNTRGALERNVIEPMRAMYGEALVGPMRSDGVVMLFGEKVHCLGANNKRQVDKLRGTSVKYCYGDEVVTWEPEVFEMLKSRLDKPYSCFDGTCNPAHPEHWLKRFVDSGADVFYQQYALADNPFLDSGVRAALEREHTGVHYDRYILGEWKRAEGLVFPMMAEEPERYVVSEEGLRAGGTADLRGGGFDRLVLGVDFGGNGSMTTFCLTGYERYHRLTVLTEDGVPLGHGIDAEAICERFVAFYGKMLRKHGKISHVLCDSASPTLINSLISATRRAGLPHRCIGPCTKNEVSQRPITVDRMLGSGRLRFSRECPETVRALGKLCWDSKRSDEPEDKNVGNINDRWDAFCYTWIDFAEYLERW